MKIRRVGAEMFRAGWRTDVTKLIFAFRNFSNEPKNGRSSYFSSILYLGLIHRMSIKYFPNYKHLLQENYVEYKHIFYHYLSYFLKFYVMCLLLRYSCSVKMASMKGKAQCVLWYHETKSPVTVQRKFRN